MKTSRFAPFFIIIVIALIVAACSPSTPTPTTLPPDTPEGRPTATPLPPDTDTPTDEPTPSETPEGETGDSDESGWLDWDAEESWEGTGGAILEAGGGEFEEEAPAEEVYESEGAPPPMAADESMATAPALDSRSDKGEANTVSELRAGSVDDNAEWDDYLLYRIKITESNLNVIDVDVTERHTFTVTNAAGNPILGARISVFAGEDELAVMRTYADGRALFFPKATDEPDAQSYHVIVEKDGTTTEFDIDRDTREHAVALEASSASDPVRLDVLFLIDVTGSMGDEIQQLKDNMIAISEQIDALPGDPDVRFAMTVYRDEGDAFVSRTFDFTPDVVEFTEALRMVQASGGGDYPEDLEEGLFDAIHKPEWRVDNTVSLIFLVADAPPQLYPDDYDYTAQMFEASERGMKIFPIASSGLDDQGEYIFRQLAQSTLGKFIFLTYGAGGDPSSGSGDETTHHVEDYSVLSLDQLVVRLVEDELAHLTPEQ